MNSEMLLPFRPDPDRLFDQLRSHISDNLLHAIAALDYGQASELHFAELLSLRDEPYSARELGIEPKEVLELGLSGPPYPAGKAGLPSLSESEGQLCHVFIAASVLRNAMDFQPSPMLEHVLFAAGHLSVSMTKFDCFDNAHAASLCAWSLQKLPEHTEDLPFLAIALAKISLGANVQKGAGQIEDLLEWAWEMETCGEEDRAFGRGMFQRDIIPASWRKIGKQMSETKVGGLSERSHELLHRIGHLIACRSRR